MEGSVASHCLPRLECVTPTPTSVFRGLSALALALAVIPCVGSRLAAQGAGGWEGGLKTGISHVETGTQEFDWSGTSSSAVFLRRGIGGPFSIQPEMAHVRRSGVSTVPGSTLRLVADYVELPIMLQAGTRTAIGFAPFVAIGPSVAFRLRCRLQFAGGGLNTNDNCENQSGRRSSVFDLGVGAGAGFGWTVGMTTLSVESRLTAGLLTSVLPTDVGGARSMGWSVLAGASIPLARRRAGPAAPAPPWMPPLAAIPSPSTIVEPAAPVVVADTRVAARPRVSITADNADAREVLLAIGRTAGVNVVVSPEIRTRVTATLVDVPADQAIQAIVDVLGLSILQPRAPGQATIVFHQPAVNVNNASAEQIAARFGVSAEMARWLAENQPAGIAVPPVRPKQP